MTRTAFCRCCGMDDAIFAEPRIFNGLPSNPSACGVCSRHLGSSELDLNRRNAQHIEMWRERLREVREEAAEQFEQAKADTREQVAEMRAELNARPTQVVYRNLDQETVDDAVEKRDAAYRTRDRVLQDMTRLHMLHFETDTGACRCGRQADECEEGRILDRSKVLRGWERLHTERRRDGKTHALPEHHPGIIDARWDPDDDDQAEELRQNLLHGWT